uniref:Putative methyltransferase n=1 Tax=viral metagenome TaxID=1070528 RepID=A0A6M3IGP4_9ZZZZ
MINPYYETPNGVLYHGDNRDALPFISGCTACVTDPPYGLGFMGKDWDHGVPGTKYWKLILDSCLPGAPLMAFGGTRTVHRLVCAIEDAGWEIRDGIEYLHWIYGSGFPKSLDISKAIDKAAGAEREIIKETKTKSGGMACVNRANKEQGFRPNNYNEHGNIFQTTTPATEAAQKWNGYGTALKPAHEPISLSFKPIEKNFANNALTHGVAGLNIEGGRVATDEDQRRPSAGGDNGLIGTSTFKIHERKINDQVKHQGRWPSNIIHDGSPEVLALFPENHGHGSSQHSGSEKGMFPWGTARRVQTGGEPGSAARFFYCAKASRSEREAGCGLLPLKKGGLCSNTSGQHITRRDGGAPDPVHNKHPTVKPLELIKYLITLVTMPEKNLIIDPFAGSGTTPLACEQLGLPWVACEKEEESCHIIVQRIENERKQRKLFA